jgi:hypothetical protein
MTDMMATIAPKSNQLNADDLIGGRNITIKVTKVAGVSGEQPIAINYEGDNGKPYMPCKSMRRVLVHLWGDKGQEYVGRSMTLYCDPTVKFGGMEVGGIRISHMSHITKEITIALTSSKANRKPFTVKPLVVAEQPTADETIAAIEQAKTLDDLKTIFSAAQKAFKDSKDFAKIYEAKERRKKELMAGDGVHTEGSLPSDPATKQA